jgi:hypothetical protein
MIGGMPPVTVRNGPDDVYLASEMGRRAEAVLVAMDPDVDLAGAESDE